MSTALEPLVVSTTSISDYRRCKKKFELAWVLDRDVPSSEAAELGTSFHEIMAAVARRDRDWLTAHTGDPMYEIALEYIKRHAFPSNVLAVEEPIYTLVLPEDGRKRLPAVYIRSTHDLVYKDEHGWIVVRDYKTFAQKPTLYVDLDFQGRLYIAASMKHWQTDDVRFEYEYVRRELRRELKGKGIVDWTDDERYVRVPLLVPGQEIQTLWKELRYDCDELRTRLVRPDKTVWTRTDLKAGPHACSSCFHRDLCAAEMAQGGLSDDTLEFHSKPRDPADRMTARGILGDPRVEYWRERYATEQPANIENPLSDAVTRVYGARGRDIVIAAAALTQGAA